MSVGFGNRAASVTNSRMPKSAAGSSLQAQRAAKNPADANRTPPRAPSSQIRTNGYSAKKAQAAAIVWLFSVCSNARRYVPQAAAKRLRNQAQSSGACRSRNRAYRTRKTAIGTTFRSTTTGLKYRTYTGHFTGSLGVSSTYVVFPGVAGSSFATYRGMRGVVTTWSSGTPRAARKGYSSPAISVGRSGGLLE